jgi:hypothetical protein
MVPIVSDVLAPCIEPSCSLAATKLSYRSTVQQFKRPMTGLLKVPIVPNLQLFQMFNSGKPTNQSGVSELEVWDHWNNWNGWND